MPALAHAAQGEIRTARRRAAGRSWASLTSSSVSRHFTGARIALNAFPDKAIPVSAVTESRASPAEGLARVPYCIYRGDTWNFLGLEAELTEKGDFKTTFAGEMPVVVTRDESGAIRCFENRCAHRGALLCLKDRGNVKEIACVYHNWTYDLRGNLTAVAFRRVMKEPVKILGGYTQVLQSNWKLYFENVKDTYHASLLHLFFSTFRLNRLEQRGGVIVGGDGGSHVSFTMMKTDSSGDEYERAGMRSVSGGYRLEAPQMLESVDEFGDGVTLQILTVFPGFVLQQIMNSLAVRQVLPKGVNRTELVWTAFGYASDDEKMAELRLKQSNLIGPAGYISLEDGAATAFVQRGAAGASERASFIEMGGRGVESNESRVTETSVRGLWQQYRKHMGL